MGRSVTLLATGVSWVASAPADALSMTLRMSVALRGGTDVDDLPDDPGLLRGACRKTLCASVRGGQDAIHGEYAQVGTVSHHDSEDFAEAAFLRQCFSLCQDLPNHLPQLCCSRSLPCVVQAF